MHRELGSGRSQERGPTTCCGRVEFLHRQDYVVHDACAGGHLVGPNHFKLILCRPLYCVEENATVVVGRKGGRVSHRKSLLVPACSRQR